MLPIIRLTRFNSDLTVDIAVTAIVSIEATAGGSEIYVTSPAKSMPYAVTETPDEIRTKVDEAFAAAVKTMMDVSVSEMERAAQQQVFRGLVN